MYIRMKVCRHTFYILEKDPEIVVFGRILKNECEEGFDQFQSYTKKIIQNIIRDLIKENFKYLNEDELMK